MNFVCSSVGFCGLVGWLEDFDFECAQTTHTYCLIIVELMRKKRTKRAAKLSTRNQRLRAGCDLAISKRQRRTLIIMLVHQRMLRKFFKCCLAAGTPCKSSLSKYFFVPIRQFSMQVGQWIARGSMQNVFWENEKGKLKFVLI